MTVYGITPAGFVRKPRAAILADIEAAQLATLDPALDVHPGQPLGKINAVIATLHDGLWALVESVYHSNDRDGAEGDALEALAKLIGTLKNAASFARCEVTVVTSQALDLTPGTHFVQLDTDATVRFTVESPFSAPSAGVYPGVVFRAETAGPLLAPAPHLDVIATPVVGWDAANNTTDAEGGAVADDDDALRTKMAEEVARTGVSTVASLTADLLSAVVGTPPTSFVVSATIFENTTDFVDANGLPPHSFEALVYDGASPTSDQSDAIAQTILDGGPAGIGAVGSSSGTAHRRVNGEPTGDAVLVAFSRVVALPVFLDVTVEISDSVVYAAAGGDAAVISAIVGAVRLHRKTGDPVYRSRLVASIFAVPGIANVSALALDFRASPTATTDLPVRPREVATFDETNISVTS